MPVDVVVARLDTVVDAIGATGQIEAVQSIELRPEVGGRLVRILAREGTEVRAGTALFKIDDAELLSQVARLEADRDLAKQALARTRELIERSASSQADLELAEASFRSAEAQLQLQQTRLDRTVVRAPFGGIVGERFVSVGDYVTSADPLTTLQTADPQRASFQVPERFSQKLALGQEITFQVASVPDRVFEGTVDFVDPRVRLPGRTITVKASVANADRALKPGMFIEARLATDVRGEAVVVPEDAILPLQGVGLRVAGDRRGHGRARRGHAGRAHSRLGRDPERSGRGHDGGRRRHRADGAGRAAQPQRAGALTAGRAGVRRIPAAGPRRGASSGLRPSRSR